MGLRDAEKLDWPEGQLKRRKKVITAAMEQHAAREWEEEAELYGLWKTDKSKENADDNMFERHGWNEVDSAFDYGVQGRKRNPTTSWSQRAGTISTQGFVCFSNGPFE